MQLTNLKNETKELIINSLDIYHALQNKCKLYRRDGIESLSLYAGVLRLGKTISISIKEPIRTNPGSGYPYPNGMRPDDRDEKTDYRQFQYHYENIVCKILNAHNITIEQVVEILHLDQKLTAPNTYSPSEKVEKQHNIAYRALLQTIRNYYIASAKLANAERPCTPLIELDIPTIISALHYPNIDSTNSILELYSKLKGTQFSPDTVPDYLEEIESEVHYEEELCKRDENGQLELYRIKKPLVMNKNIGRII